jgi:hypothetical protein
VKIRYTAGYALAADVPKPIIQAMLLHIGDMYENREMSIIGVSVSNTNAYNALLRNYKRLMF